MFDLEKSAAVSQKSHREGVRYVKSRKILKTASRIKVTGNRPQDPILAGKSISRAFQCVSRIILKLPELREKLFFLSSDAHFWGIFLKTHFGHSVGPFAAIHFFRSKSVGNREIFFPGKFTS